MRVLSKEELYRHNQKKIKFYKIASPIVFWVFLALAVIFLIVALANSFGNVNEITEMLDTKTHTGEELQANYAYLTEKYGEWVIGNGDKNFQIVFIDVKAAVFSGIMISCTVMASVYFAAAYILGKWLFPALAKKTLQDNQDMVNLTILKNEK